MTKQLLKKKLNFEQNLLQYGILKNIWPKVKFLLKWVFIFIVKKFKHSNILLKFCLK